MSDLHAKIADIERESGGNVSVAFRNLGDGCRTDYNAGRKVKTASVIKLPILVHAAMSVEEGKLTWDERLNVTVEDRVAGSGVLSQLTGDNALTIRDLAVLMTIVSDNVATNVLIDRLGVDAINARCELLGLNDTRLFRKIGSEGPPISPENETYGIAVTTPNDMANLMTQVAKGAIGETAAEDTLDILGRQQLLHAIPRLLPSDWKYAGKTGSLDHLRNDVGLVTAPDGRMFVLAIFVQELPGSLWTADNPGLLAIARITRVLVAT